MCEVQRPSSGTYYNEKNDLGKDSATLEVQVLHEIDGLTKKEPRSYAEMIASYNEIFYGTSSTSGVLGDRLSSAVIIGMCRSPFSTASPVSLKLKSSHRAIKSANICAANLNAFSQDAKFSSEASPTRYQNRYDSKTFVGSNELEKTSASYAKMIEKYSNAMNLTRVDNISRSSTCILKRNVSTKINENLIIPLQAKDLNNKSPENSWNDESKNVTETLTKGQESLRARNQNDWSTKVDDIVKDLKRVMSKTETNETNSKDKWMLQSVNEHAYWLDRVVSAHKRSIKERVSMPKDAQVNSTSKEDIPAVHSNPYSSTPKEDIPPVHSNTYSSTPKEDILPVHSNTYSSMPKEDILPVHSNTYSSTPKEDILPVHSNTYSSTPKEDTPPVHSNTYSSTPKEDTPPVRSNTYNNTGHSIASILNENEGDNLPSRYPLVMTRDKTSKPVVDYIRRGPASSNKPPQGQTPANTAATNSTREPQIELRMTPSQNESVVSINVDEAVVKTGGAANQEQLSVVISSKKNETSQASAGNPSANTDFGSMQISISENTIPVKQIEFSINGKPVSELKSILARSDKLDVVSSMDKVEIRIPSRNNSASKEQSKNTASARSSSKPVLNLQIAAKFNEPRYQQPRGAEMKTDPPHMPPPAQPAQPTPPPTPRIPPVPSRPPRQHNLFNKDGTYSGPTNSEPWKGAVTRTTENVELSSATNVKSTSSLPKEEKTSSATKGVSSTAKPKEAAAGGNVNAPSTTNPGQLKVGNKSKDENKSSESQRSSSSNIISWWSTQDSFQKIEKKDTPKAASAVDNASTSQQTKEKLPEKKLNSNVTPPQKEDSVNPKKTDVADDKRKDALPKIPVDDDNKKTDFPDPIVNIVRVRSPQRWVPAKCSNETKGGSTLVGSRRLPTGGRIAKRTKYRTRGNVHNKRSNDAQPISAVSPPKIVKFVPVEPRIVSVEKKTDAKASSAKEAVDDRQKTQKVVTESKTDTKIEKTAAEDAGSQIGKANVQHSNTLFKEKGDVRGGVNRSADVSAKSVPSAGKIGGDIDKEEKRRGEGGAAESNLPSTQINEEQRIKEILKTMKPIEKRKDGTLIDYGVTVPSRKPSKKVKQIPVVRSKSSVNAAPEEPKIVEPEKVSSTKKETLTEPKSTVVETRSVEPAQISSVKKPVEVLKNNDAKFETKKEVETKSKVQTGNTVNEATEQKVGATANKSISEIKRSATTSRERKSNVSDAKEAASSPRTSQPFKRPSSSGTLTDKSKNVSLADSQLPIPEKKESKDALKLAEQKKVESAAITPSKVVDKPVKNINSPRSSTAKPSDSQKPSGKIAKSDDTSSKESSPRLGNASKTDIASLEGTINYCPSKNQNNPTKLVNVNEEKKVSSDLSSQRKSDSLKLDVTKKPSNKGGGRSGSGAPPTGPGGLTSQLKDTKTPVTCSRQEKNRNDKGSGPGQYSDKTYSLLSERPEKNMLYSSWLQRFKGELDKDKTI
ncbi:unnamed protein product [Xylocopa violacea]|uniref:Uncharacterized protein n=1 Tax=Xylocopa violacea TaxID=135666 RepID=A0ABP1NY95_XYLVO